jgi:hypothetical protein
MVERTKKWFIEYLFEEKSFVTIPDFAPKIFDNSKIISFYNQINSDLFYSNIFKFKLNLNQLDLSNHYDEILFPNVKHLSLYGDLTNHSLDQIRFPINTHNIQYFQINTNINDINHFSEFLKDLPNLNSFDIQSRDILHLFGLIRILIFRNLIFKSVLIQ